MSIESYPDEALRGEDFTETKRELAKQNIIKSLQSGAGFVQSCEVAAIGRATLYLWRKKDKQFDIACEDAKKSRVTYVEDALYKKALEGNIVACIFYLKNRAGWKDVNTGGGVGDNNQIQVIITNNHGPDIPSDTQQRSGQENYIDGEAKPLLTEQS